MARLRRPLALHLDIISHVENDFVPIHIEACREKLSLELSRLLENSDLDGYLRDLAAVALSLISYSEARCEGHRGSEVLSRRWRCAHEREAHRRAAL